MIQYSNQRISSDIPAPQDVDDLRYVDEPPELTFTTANQDAAVDFYRSTGRRRFEIDNGEDGRCRWEAGHDLS